MKIFYPNEIVVVGCISQMKFILLILGQTCQHAVEDVVVSLILEKCIVMINDQE